MLGDAQDLNEENFIAIMRKLGGKYVSIKMMLPYFKIKKAQNPQNHWPQLRVMAKKPKEAFITNSRIQRASRRRRKGSNHLLLHIEPAPIGGEG